MNDIITLMRDILGAPPNTTFGECLEYTFACCLAIVCIATVCKILVRLVSK